MRDQEGTEEYVSTAKWRPACAKPLRRRQGTQLGAFFNAPSVEYDVAIDGSVRMSVLTKLHMVSRWEFGIQRVMWNEEEGWPGNHSER
jgi:hypothetical protein